MPSTMMTHELKIVFLLLMPDSLNGKYGAKTVFHAVMTVHDHY